MIYYVKVFYPRMHSIIKHRDRMLRNINGIKDKILEMPDDPQKVVRMFAHYRLQYHLKKVLNISVLPDFSYNKNGKPYLKEYPDVHFNLSHTDSAIAFIISDRVCGIDIEKRKNISNTLKNMPENPSEDFFDYWCKKECYVKFKGDNILKYLHKDIPKNLDFQKLEVREEFICYYLEEK